MINPQGMDLKFWADSLLIDFPNDNIPILLEENDWRRWGNDLVQAQTFAINSAPTTEEYLDWYSWAQEVYYTMLDNA